MRLFFFFFQEGSGAGPVFPKADARELKGKGTRKQGAQKDPLCAVPQDQNQRDWAGDTQEYNRVSVLS